MKGRMAGRLSAGVLAAGGLATGGPALAHHSFAMFDRDREVTLTGTIHDFQWTNPHAWVEVDVANSRGGADKWGIELNSPNNLARQGWRSSFFRRGDKVTVVLNPLRSGEHGGLFLEATLADGRVIADHFVPRPGDAASHASSAPATAK